MSGFRRLGLVSAASVLAVVGINLSLPVTLSAERTSPATAAPVASAPVVPNAVTARWLSKPDGGTWVVSGAQLALRSVEPLHDVVVHLMAEGPVSVTGPHALRIGNLSASGRTISIPVITRRSGVGVAKALISARDAVGQPVGGEADLQVAADGTTVAYSTHSALDASVALLETQRAILGKARYLRDLDLLRRGGPAAQIFGPATLAADANPSITPANTPISGSVNYTASDGSVHPARDIMVQVWDQDGVSSGEDSLVATVWTDAGGFYTTSVSTFRSDGVTNRALYVRALAEGDVGGDNFPAFIVHAPGLATAQYMQSTGADVAEGQPLTISLTANNSAASNTAFDVADALESGVQFTLFLDSCNCLGTPLNYGQTVAGPLSVEFPSSSGTSQFLYDANPPLLQILQSDQFNWVTILHEYGHSIARQLKIDGAPGGVSHTLGQNLSVPPAISPANKLAGLETAWSEGFADFFAVYVEEFESAYTFHIPGVVDGSIEQYGYDLSLNNVQGVKVSDGVHSSAPVGTVIPINPTGEDNELSVARTLWQFIKQPDIALPATKLFSTLQAAQATTLSAAIPALMQAGNAATFDDANNSSATAVGNANDFACVLSANAVAPLMITPADDTQVDPNTPIKFSWNPGGAGAIYPLDQFTVQFWSADWDKLVFQSQPQSTTSYTPSPPDWQTIVTGSDASGGLVSSLNVTVKGTSAADPSSGAAPTGPYKSCATTLTINRPPADLAEPTDLGGSLFGRSVGLSQDGTTSVVGAPGPCLGIIQTTSGCGPGTVSLYSLNTATDLWKQTAVFSPGDLGLPGCTDNSCPGATVIGSSVAISGDGMTAAASVAIDPDSTLASFGPNWNLVVVTFALVNGAWTVTGQPYGAPTESTQYVPNSSAAPFETVALDDVGDELLVGDQYHQNSNLEAGSTSSNAILSEGVAYSFTSAGTGAATGFIYTRTIPDPTQDPYTSQNCAAEDCNTLWDETFASSIALSGDGKTAMVSDQGNYTPWPATQVDTNESADLFTASVDPSNGIRTWGTVPDVLMGGDVATSYTEEDGLTACNGQPCIPEDFGSSLALSDNGLTAFVGDASHNLGSGSVYAFTPPEGGPQTAYGQVAELTSSDPNASGLGASLASSASGNVLVVGAPHSSDGGMTGSGDAQLFTTGSSGWVNANETYDWTADDAASYNLFGSSVALSADGSRTIAGAPGSPLYTSYLGGYDGAVYTLDPLTPTNVSLSASTLLPEPNGAVEGTTNEQTDITATVAPVPSGGTVAFRDPSGPIAGCTQVPVDPLSGTAECPLTLPADTTVDPSTGIDSPLAYAATYSGSGTYTASPPGSLDVTVVPPLTITTTTLPNIAAGSEVTSGTVTLAASGGIAPLSWSIVADSTDGLPSSMGLGPDGSFSGEIPTPGSYSFDVEVTDNSPIPQAALENLTWVVTAPSGPSPTKVVLSPLGAVPYGTTAPAPVTVSALGTNPPAGDKVLVQAAQGSTTVGSCTATLPGGSSDSASCALPATLPVGTYSVVATFEGATTTGGDPAFSTSASPPQNLTVTPISAATSISPLIPADVGSPAQITVTESTGSSVRPPAGDTVAVVAMQGATVAGTCNAVLSGAQPDAGTCSLGSALPIDSYDIIALFDSDPDYGTSGSSATLVVVGGTTTVVGVSSPTSNFGATLTYSATVSSSAGSPTGTVSFTTGSTLLCTTPALSSGQASCSTSDTPVGVDPITATYNGSSTFGQSTGSASVTVSVAEPAAPSGAITSQSAQSTSPSGTAAAAISGLSATGSGAGALTVASYGANPTSGNVAVTNGTGVYYDVAIGAGSSFTQVVIVECNLGANGNQIDYFNGSTWVPFSMQSFNSGTGCATATVNTSTTPTMAALTGTPIAAVDQPEGDFTLGISPSTETLNANTSVVYSVAVQTTTGFDQPVSLSVSGLPSGVTAQFDPATVIPNGISSMILTSGSSYVAGTNSFLVTGTGGGITHTLGGGVTLGFGLVPLCYGTISGTVTDSVTGLPIAGVVIGYNEDSDSVQTSSSGTYTTPTNVNLGANSAATETGVEVSATGYLPTSTTTLVVSCGEVSSYSVALVPKQFGALAGHVYVGVPNPADHSAARSVAATSTVIPGAQISIGGAAYTPTTGSDGSYSQSNVALSSTNGPKPYGMTASETGYWPSIVSATVVANATTTQDFALVPICTGSITATVYDQATGLPLAGATVSGVPSSGTDTTNSSGVVTFPAVQLGTNNSTGFYTIEAENAQDTGSSSAVTATLGDCGDSTSVSLYVVTPVNNYGTVQTEVKDSATGDPLFGATVSTCNQPSLTTDGGGSVTDPNILVGTGTTTSILCSINANENGYYSGSVTTTIEANQTTAVDVSLVPELSTTIVGTVTNAVTGQPLAGIDVNSATTNAVGQYTLTGNDLLGNDNASQAVNVDAIDLNGNYLEARGAVTVSAGGTSTLNLSMAPQCGPATVSGTVYNANTLQPIAGATVQGSEIVTTNSQGQFSMVWPVYQNMPFSGSLTASATGFNSARETVELFCGARVVLNFGGNNTETGALSGTVTAQGTGDPVSGAFVGTAFGATTTTNSLGQYSFANVPLGNNNAAQNWNVTVDPPAGSDLQPAIESVTVGPDPPAADLDFQLGTTPPPVPVAVNLTESTPENTELSVAAPGVLAADSGSNISVTGFEAQTSNGGEVAVQPDGAFTYTPDGAFQGTDTFTYTITDEYGVTATATVTILVGSFPSAADYAESTMAGTTLTVDAADGLGSEDTGTGLTYALTDAPSNGTAIVNSDGSYTYAPNAAFSGVDSFTYTVTNSADLKATGTVTITAILPPPPIAPDYSESTPFHTSLTVPAAGVLSQATGTGLSAALTTPPADGYAVVKGNGGYSYAPDASYSGTDTFDYTVTDQFHRTAKGTVTISVSPEVNAPPTAPNYSETTILDTPLVVSAATGVLSGATGQNISITATTDPSHGTVVVAADGSYTYTPDAGYVGPDSFTYTVTDAQDRTATGTVTINVEAPTPPTAPNYTASTPFDTELTVVAAQGLLAQATGTGITLTSSTAAAHGTVVVNADGSYTYTPDAGYAGPDSFTYTVTDADAQTATGTVTIHVGTPAAPTAADYSESTPFDTPLSVSASNGLGSQDTGTALTYALSISPSHGTAVVDSNGSYSYTPDATFSGADSFTYTVTDPYHQAATGTVTVQVGSPAPASPTSHPVNPLTCGNRLVALDGGVFDYGCMPFLGSLGSTKVAAPIVDMAATPDGWGYWLVGRDGGIFAFGDAPFLGSLGGQAISAPIVGMAETPDGRGYWLVGADGGVYAFGDAPFLGSLGGRHLSAPIVGIAATPGGQGYWLVGSDGAMYPFGSAPDLGSMAGVAHNGLIVGIAATPDGQGYWLVGSDGGVYTFGDASFDGSMGGKPVNTPIVGIEGTLDGGGYWLVSSDGGVYAFGDSAFYGSMGGRRLNQPMSGIF